MSKLILVTVFLFFGSAAFDSYDDYAVKDIPAHAVKDYYAAVDVVTTQRSALKAIQERERLQIEQRESIESIKLEIRALQRLHSQVVEML